MKPEETIDFHIRWIWQKISRIYNTEASKFGGTMSVGFVLLNIDKEGTPSTKLGPKMGIESRSLTRTLKTMEEEKLIIRKPDKNDKRMVRVFLTEKGEEYRITSKQTVINFNKFIQQKISKSKLENFFSTMEKLNTLLDSPEIFQCLEKEQKSDKAIPLK